jgi:hypothetical protein
MVMTAKLQVLAREAPVPVEVICAWLRNEARRALLVEGAMVEMSPLTAQRIAAELESRVAGGR